MKRAIRIALLLGLIGVALLLHPSGASAHPLGNFTINHYSRLEPDQGALRILYVLDFAEIPTFQQMKRLDPNGDGALDAAEATAYLDAELPALVAGLRLAAGDRALPLTVEERAAVFVPGQGGLPTLRVECRLRADLPADWRAGDPLRYADRNYPDRLGWREIVVQGGADFAIADSTAPATDLSNELRAYPDDLLSSPPALNEATFTLTPASGADSARAAAQTAAGRAGESARGDAATGRLSALLAVERLTPGALAATLLAALVWGAAHALSPGHGKAVVAAYLVGARGTAKHAAFLGLTVTVTHTAGVFALGLVTLALSQYLLPETLYPWLNVLSGLLVVAIGLNLVWQRARGLFAQRRSAERHAHDGHAHANGPSGYHHHDHDHDHSHSHGGHTHSHLPPNSDGSRVTWRGLLALGVSGGLVPCPSALVLLLAAISLGRVGFGLALVLAFSAGLALVLTAIGLVCVYATRLFRRLSFEARPPRFLPVASAAAITLAGAAIVFDALRQAGIV